MKGYIGVTSSDWWNYLKNKKINIINFWNRKESFNVIERGDVFFFLKKNDLNETGERAVV